MIVIDAHKVIREILAKQETCSFYDINLYRAEHEKSNPNEYIEVDSNSVFSIVDCYPQEFYWDTKAEVIRKQEIFICPICNSPHKKYPNTENFKNLKDKRAYSIEDIHTTFYAGYNRGIYAASVLQGNPINDKYLPYEEYLKHLNRSLNSGISIDDLLA
jgi:hypothetical protein